MFGGNLEVNQGCSVEGTLKMLLGRAVECVANDEYDGSTDESKTYIEILYETCGDVDMNANGKVGSGHSTGAYSSSAELDVNAANEKHVGQSSNSPDPSVVCQGVPSRVVETFGHDIISSCYLTSVSVSARLERENGDQKEHDLKEIRRSLTDRRDEEFKSLEGDDVNKMLYTKKLRIQLRRRAVNLLIDAGWRITERTTQVRGKVINNLCYISRRGPVVYSLAKAWVSCGAELYAQSSNPEYDRIGRQWSDIDEFYVEMADTLAYIEKEIRQPKSIRSQLLQWQLLDPFMAVVCVNRKIGLLKEGNVLKAVKSETSIVDGPEAEASDGSEEDKIASNSCSKGSSRSSLVPIFMPDLESKNSENYNHDYLVNRHRFAQGNYTAYRDANICNQSIRSLKNMARCKVKHKTSAKKPETKSQAAKRGTSTKKTLCKHNKLSESGSASDPNKTSCRALESDIKRRGHARRVIHFEEIDKAGCHFTTEAQPRNAMIEARDEELKEVVERNTKLSRDARNFFLINQTFVPSLKEQQAVYLYQPVNMPAEQHYYYQPVIRGMNEQQAVQTSVYQPVIQGVNMQQATLLNDNCREAFGRDTSDNKIRYLDYSVPRDETVKSTASNSKGRSKPWRMTVEDSFDLQESSSMTKKLRSHAKSVNIASRQNNKEKAILLVPVKNECADTLLKFDRDEDDVPLASDGISML